MAPRILYIEDNIDNMKLIRRILLAEGYEILEATSADEGISLAVQQLPDLILMDINLPDMDGLQAASTLRQIPELRSTPIIALTANVMRDVLDRALRAGCNGFIAKPIDVDQFSEQLMIYLGG